MAPEYVVINAVERFAKNKIEREISHSENIAALERQKTIELIDSARSKSSKFFKEHIQPPPDDLITHITNAQIRLREHGLEKFALTILPHRYISKHHSFLVDIKKTTPSAEFFDKVENKIYPADTCTLIRGVYLIDTTEKPDRATRRPAYKNDSAMTEFMNQKTISNKILLSRKNSDCRDQEINRFNLTANEIDNLVLLELTNQINAPSIAKLRVKLPRFIEFNMMANLIDADISTGCTEEWFGDDSQRGFGVTFVGGKGISQVRPEWKHHRSPTIGFRPMLVFNY